jgi:PBP1b-binding outer membrane lipoprotein LpoB
MATSKSNPKEVIHMKRFILLIGLLCLALILSGCGKKEEPAPAEKPAVEQEKQVSPEKPAAAPEAEKKEEAAPGTPADEKAEPAEAEHEEHKEEQKKD